MDFGGMSRRDFLKVSALGTAALSVAKPFEVIAGGGKKLDPKAKSVIQIWLWGGASQIDTFDPKPDAGYDYCGPLNKAIGTNVDGIQLNAMLPKLAEHAEKYSLIRSMTHGINGHETASYRVQTGRKPGRLVYPSFGAVVSLFKGYSQGYEGIVPPYIVLTQPQGRFSEAGFLGQKYKPFSTSGDPAKNPFIVEGIIAEGITDEQQKKRRKLLASLDTLGNAMPGNKQFELFDKSEAEAYKLMLGDAKDLFDLKKEKESVRKTYGMNTFGQSCLMARRLVEQGVPYVTINYKGWDTHKQHFDIMKRKLPELDTGLSALLEDLSQRGLLDSTIVWCGGEFGRGPKVKWDAPWNGGRGHFGNCFSTLVAGGGFKGGNIVGKSDKHAANVEERPVYPEDLIGSMCQLLGVDPDGKLPNPKNLDMKVMPSRENGSGRLTEIM